MDDEVGDEVAHHEDDGDGDHSHNNNSDKQVQPLALAALLLTAAAGFARSALSLGHLSVHLLIKAFGAIIWQQVYLSAPRFYSEKMAGQSFQAVFSASAVAEYTALPCPSALLALTQTGILC